jgi:ABC-2 type transport system permease protein
MRAIWTIAGREFRRYFISPLAYAGAAFIFLILGGIFSLNVGFGLPTGQINPDGRMLIQPLVFVLLFVTPAFTMRLLAEEQRMGTLELLLTAPVRDWELVVGKWLGSFGFMMVIVAGTWIYPLLINRFTDPGIDQGAFIGAYVGLTGFVAAILAIGLFASSLFSSPAAAYVAAVGITLGLWILGGVRAGVGTGSQIVSYLGLVNHYYDNLYQGIIDLSDLVYYASLTALALFLTSQIVESRRWR